MPPHAPVDVTPTVGDSHPSYQPPKEETSYSTNFRMAVSTGNLEQVKALVEEHGTQMINTEHWHGNTPVFEAARSGQLKILEWLVESGASVDDANEWGDTPINEAASMGHFDVVWFLADRGANISRAQGGGKVSRKVGRCSLCTGGAARVANGARMGEHDKRRATRCYVLTYAAPRCGIMTSRCNSRCHGG